MPKAFDFSTPPFDRLRPTEVERVSRAVDVAFFREGQTVVARDTLPDRFHVIIKGLVEERDAGGATVTVHESGDGFDSGILVHQAARHDFVVREEAICYVLPIEDFLDLTANNPAFAAFFFKDISHKLEALGQQRANPQALGALTTRVGQAMLHAPAYVLPTCTLHEAAVRMEETGQRGLLVRDGDAVGIFTGVDLTRAAVAERQPLDTPVRDLVHWGVYGIEEGAFLFEAALLMARHRVRHLAVRGEGGAIVGVLDAANVLSSLANQADPIGALIDRARTPAELAEAGERIGFLVRQLHDSGTKVGFITELSTDLHRRITAKLFAQLAPEGMAENACLVVMGSEGRAEYLAKTDQDNGLILKDGYDPPELPAFRVALTDALIAAGFPACPGEIMVRNPAWSKPLDAWRRDALNWILKPDEQALMNVAIFYDAAPVAGDASLLAAARGHLFDMVADNRAFLARFARAIDLFGTPLGFFSTFRTDREHQDGLDLKKGGIFPIVHGVRALALERRLEETNTVERIRRLQAAGGLDKGLAVELSDAFQVLMGLRLSTRLEKMRLHQPLDNFIRPAAVSKLERDLLKDALQIVKRFKEVVRHRFHLDRF